MKKPLPQSKGQWFFMDITEVTNAQYAKICKGNWIILLLRNGAIDWEEMKTQVPEGTPKTARFHITARLLDIKKTRLQLPQFL